VEGKSSLFILTQKTSHTRLAVWVSLKFIITQHSRDTVLSNSLVNNLGCDIVIKYYIYSTVYFVVVVKFLDIVSKIIPLLDN